MYIDLVYCYNDKIGYAILEVPRFSHLDKGAIILDDNDTQYQVIKSICVDADRDVYDFIQTVWMLGKGFRKAKSYFREYDFEYPEERKEV